MLIDIAKISFIEWMNFSILMRTAQTREAIEILDRYIIDWEYDIPTDKGLRSLPNVIEVNKCLRLALNSVEEKVESLGIEDVVVDLTKWNFDQYDNWEKARLENRWNDVVNMIHEVAKLSNTGEDKILNCVDGLRMAKAIVEVYQQSFLAPDLTTPYTKA